MFNFILNYYISDISYQALKDHCGIKAVIFDKDNTLTAPYANILHPRAKFGLQSALGKFIANRSSYTSCAHYDMDLHFH